MIYNTRRHIDKHMKEEFMRKLRARNDPACVASRIEELKMRISRLESKGQTTNLCGLRRCLLGLQQKHSRLVGALTVEDR